MLARLQRLQILRQPSIPRQGPMLIFSLTWPQQSCCFEALQQFQLLVPSWLQLRLLRLWLLQFFRFSPLLLLLTKIACLS